MDEVFDLVNVRKEEKEVTTTIWSLPFLMPLMNLKGGIIYVKEIIVR